MRTTFVASCGVLVLLGALATGVTIGAARRTGSAGSSQDIGTAGPVGGVIAAANGNWFVLCQARKDTDRNGTLDTTYDIHFDDGDQMLPYLVLGTGPGIEIDYPAARSRNGEWLAVVHGGKLELIDGRDTTFKRTQLVADLDNDWHWMRDKNARFVSIAANATRMTYLAGNTITIRELPSGAERTVTVNDRLWRADVDPEGRWARVLVMRSDTDRDGKIEIPGGRAPRSLTECSVDILHHGNPDGDEPTTLWLDLVNGMLVEDATILGPLGDALLRRRADGAIMLDGEQIVEPACDARIAQTIVTPPRIAFTCRAKRAGTSGSEQAPLEIAGPKLRLTTGKLAYHDDNDWLDSHDRFEMLDDKRDRYVDFADGSVIQLPAPYETSDDEHVVIQHDGGWAVFDLARRTTTKLVGARGSKADWQGFGIVEIGDAVYHLASAQRLGSTSESIVGLDSRGRVLVRVGRDAPAGHYSRGPLRWR